MMKNPNNEPMLASEFIKMLQKQIDKYGDLKMYRKDARSVRHHVISVEPIVYVFSDNDERIFEID